MLSAQETSAVVKLADAYRDAQNAAEGYLSGIRRQNSTKPTGGSVRP